jgi:hypothetical protein
MFRCELCHTVVHPRQRSTKIVLVTRPRTYASRGTERRERPGRPPRGRFPQRNKETEYDKGGVGTEIVREAMVCPKCAEEHQKQMAALAATAPPPAVIPDLPEVDIGEE